MSAKPSTPGHSPGRTAEQSAAQQALVAICSVLKEYKAENVCAYDLREEGGLFEYIVLASGTSLRHQQALMRHLLEECGHLELLGVEGERHADWILLDFNAVVVHLMLEETRTYYDLEQLWGDLQIGASQQAGKDRAAP